MEKLDVQIGENNHQQGHADVEEDEYLVVSLAQRPERKEDVTREHDEGDDPQLYWQDLHALCEPDRVVEDERVAERVYNDMDIAHPRYPAVEEHHRVHRELAQDSHWRPLARQQDQHGQLADSEHGTPIRHVSQDLGASTDGIGAGEVGVVPNVERVERNERGNVERYHGDQDDGLKAEWKMEGEPTEAAFTASDDLRVLFGNERMLGYVAAPPCGSPGDGMVQAWEEMLDECTQT